MNDPATFVILITTPVSAFVGARLGQRKRRSKNRSTVVRPNDVDDLDSSIIDYIESEAERRSAQEGRPGFGRFAAGYIVDMVQEERQAR